MAGSQVTIMANQVEKQRLGYQAITLTNFALTTEPQIAAGSKVEIGGALFEFASLESITGWAGISNNSDVYIKFTVAGASVTASFTTTAPTWDSAKQGWYSGSERYIGGLRKDSSGNYVRKWLYDLSSGGIQSIKRHGTGVVMLDSNDLSLPNVAAGDVIMVQSDTQRAFTNNGGVYTKIKEIIAPADGTFRTYMEVYINNITHARIYKNGAAYGTDHIGGGSSPAWYNFTEDLAFVAGDLVQLYVATTSAFTFYVQNFRLKSGTTVSLLIKRLLCNMVTMD